MNNIIGLFNKDNGKLYAPLIRGIHFNSIKGKEQMEEKLKESAKKKNINELVEVNLSIQDFNNALFKKYIYDFENSKLINPKESSSDKK